MEDVDLSVTGQLVLNLECLGFNLHSVVLSKVPIRGLPARYASFRLSPEMFNATNSAAVEVVLFFILDLMDWEAVAAALPTSAGLTPDQRTQVCARLVENAGQLMSELRLAFPCVEVEQLSSFKKHAASLLELLRHLLPPETGHARRLITEAGHRMAWVCMRLSAYVVQRQATGRLDACAVRGLPATPLHAKVLKARVVRETLRFQKAAEEYLEVEAVVAQTAAQMTADYEAARAKIAQLEAAKAATTGGGAGSPARAAAQHKAAHALQRRKQLLDDVQALAAQLEGMDGALSGAGRSELSRAALEETWAASGGEGTLAARLGSGSGGGGGGGGDGSIDLADVARHWVRSLETLNASVAAAGQQKDAKGAGSAASMRARAAGPTRPVPPANVAQLVGACEAQLEPLTLLLEKLRRHNRDVQTELRPRMESELVSLSAHVAETYPLESLLPADLRGFSLSPVPQPLLSAPVPVHGGTQADDRELWLYTASP